MVRMRVIPVRSRAIGDFELVIVRLARTDGVMGMPVVVRIDGEAVPVNDARFVERVPIAHAHVRPGLDAHDRIDERAVAALVHGVAEHRRRLAGDDLLLDGRTHNCEGAPHIENRVQPFFSRHSECVWKKRIGRKLQSTAGFHRDGKVCASSETPGSERPDDRDTESCNKPST
jgi:hypothetical protein